MARTQEQLPRPLRLFGGEVRRFRLAAGLSQEQLGAKAFVSGTFIGKIERGEARCPHDLVEQLDQILDTRGGLATLWDACVENAAFPVWFDWPRVEAEATSLHTYQPLVVYGLLQTEDYARALLEGDEAAAEARIGRQQLLTRDDPAPPKLSVLLAETTLHQQVGDRDTMAAQLAALLETPRNITVQIVPGPLPAAGTVGAFVLATLPGRAERAHVETPVRGLTLSEPEDIRILAEHWDSLRARALPLGQSRQHIVEVLEAKWT